MAVRITTSPRVGRPYWTAFAELDGDSGPIDPLRFDMYAVRLGNVMFPGITNRVQRLRYFGMVCAGLRVTRPARSWNERDHARRARAAFLDFETGWAIANLVATDGEIKDRPPVVQRPRLKRDFEGLRGANNALSYFWRVDGRDRFSPHGYRLLKAQESQGGLGAYLVALREFGFVDRVRLELTSHGIRLAELFLGGSRKHPATLLSATPVRRRDLGRAGEAMLLTSATSAEARLVHDVLFQGDHNLATLVQRVPPGLRHPHAAEQALGVIANSNGNALERGAQYALDFDPFRKSGLELFAQLGTRLVGTAGPTLLSMLDDIDALDPIATDWRVAAARLVSQAPPKGLETVHALAERVAGLSTTPELVGALVSFHRQEGGAWILASGAERYELGRAGEFREPDDYFHGYTLPSALRIYEDVQEAQA